MSLPRSPLPFLLLAVVAACPSGSDPAGPDADRDTYPYPVGKVFFTALPIGRKLLDEAATRATETLSDHTDALHRIAESLIEREEITGADVVHLLDGTSPTRRAHSS